MGRSWPPSRRFSTLLIPRPGSSGVRINAQALVPKMQGRPKRTTWSPGPPLPIATLQSTRRDRRISEWLT